MEDGVRFHVAEVKPLRPFELQVRQRFGDQFKEKFWPIFQAFNTLFPVLAPEPDGDGAVASLVGASGPGGK